MKTVAAIVIAVATLKGAFAQSVTLPTCGATCMVNSVSVTSCSASDLSCLCTNSDYINVAVHCIAAQCDSTDASDAFAYATYACSTVGVTVPSVDSILDPSSSSSDPAPPATSPVDTPAAAADPTTAAADPTTTPAATTTPAGAPSSTVPPYPTNQTVTTSTIVKTNVTTAAPTKSSVTFTSGAQNMPEIQQGVLLAFVLGVVALIGAGL